MKDYIVEHAELCTRAQAERSYTCESFGNDQLMNICINHNDHFLHEWFLTNF